MTNPTKTVLITGASSGIGLATALHFAKINQEAGTSSANPWAIIATMRTPADAEANGLAGLPGINILPLDVTDRASIKAAIWHAEQRTGGIHVLINNAGYGLNGPVEGAKPEQVQAQFDVNLFGLINVTNTVLPGMRQRGDGLILNISSIGGRIGMPGAPLYISTKFAVEGLTEAQRFELKPFGIRMKLIEPGGIRTDFIKRSSQWSDHPAYSGQIAAIKKMTAGLNERLADPAEVAKVIYKAATDRSGRLRYAAKPGPYLLLYNLLPDWLWQRIIQAALRQHARTGQPE